MSQTKAEPKLIAENRKARFDYFIEDRYEAGMVLQGWEVKSMRSGKANLTEFANILAGYDSNGNGVNAAARIGMVSVGGDWIASNLVAGALAGTDMQFGTADDQVIAQSDAAGAGSQIGPIVIAGQVLGDPNSNPDTRFGFVAGDVVSLKVAGTAVGLKSGPDNDHLIVLDAAGTMTVNEV